MASNKNQHFVPRCYLRPFTLDGTQSAAINLYNIDRRRFIPNAPLKHQCSGDYFYGKDIQLEKAIQLIEVAYATAIKQIFAPGYTFTELHRVQLRVFWLLQHLRTEAASIRSSEMTESMRSSIGAPDEPDFRIEIREAVQMAMSAFAESMHIVDDMRVCLVKNRTATPFFTSDDPAILTNRFYLDSAKVRGKSFGMGSAGDILLLPLSPKVLFLGYDGDAYSVPNENGWTEARRDADVEAFNEHQLLNCRANLFVQDVQHAGLVHEAFARVAPSRPEVRHRINYAVKDGESEGSTRYRVVSHRDAEEHTEAMIHVQALHPKPASWPRQIAWRSNGFAFENGTGVGFVRRAFTNEQGREPFRKVQVP
jgi:hypothetical protein